MRLVIQRVLQAHVEIAGSITAAIQKGLVVLIGIEERDTRDDALWLAQKLVAMRIFGDEQDKMNLDVRDINGEILIVSQFTLHASTKKGNRPSFIMAAKPEHAVPLYEYFIEQVILIFGKNVATGQFGAMMQIFLVNDGPVTITIDSKSRE